MPYKYALYDFPIGELRILCELRSIVYDGKRNAYTLGRSWRITDDGDVQIKLTGGGLKEYQSSWYSTRYLYRGRKLDESQTS